MNLVDCVVTEVRSKPFQGYGKWWVVVHYNCWGREARMDLMLNTEQEALDVKPGYKFLA